MAKYEEIIRLHNMLVSEGVGHVFRDFRDGFMIIYPSDSEWDKVIEYYGCVPRKRHFEMSRNAMNVIENSHSYGSGVDKIEIMGMLTEEEFARDDVAVVTADEAFARIIDAEKRKAQ
jgi:spore maturation protein CgeB